MIRLPDRIYDALGRVYHAQRHMRDAERRQVVEREDRALRERFASEEALHTLGECGGAANGCRYRPCYVVSAS